MFKLLPLAFYLPILLLAGWFIGQRIRRVKIACPASAVWPESENPGLAMELATSPADADRILGARDVPCGLANREAMVGQQQHDFLLIGLYVGFFWSITVSHRQIYPLIAFVTCVAAVLAGLCGTFENLKIIQLCDNDQGSPKPFAKAKWILFFTALTLSAACFVFTDVSAFDKQVLTWLVGLTALGASVYGIVSTFRADLEELASAVKLSACVMAALAVLPLLLQYGISLTDVAEYTMLMRVPLLTALLLMALPFIARYTGAGALLMGLFDVTPLSTIPVVVAAVSVAGVACDNMRVIYSHSRDRVGGLSVPHLSAPWFWLVLTALFSLPVIVVAIHFSNRQNPGDLPKRSLFGAGTFAATLGLQYWVGSSIGLTWIKLPVWTRQPIFSGYDPPADHEHSALNFVLALGFYIGFGIYGYSRLGKRRTVPALCSALMVMMLACSSLSALSFFLDVWHVPLLIVLLLAGMITAQSAQSDHAYELKPRTNLAPAPTPLETVRATRRMLNGRIVVVAANGGGIQAAAWTAQVLEGLCQFDRFANSLRLISSVSGGSLGSACFTYRQAQPDNARPAADSASRSSLDEVAWGIGWPDLICAVFPWFAKHLIGRGRALEKAWVMNCSPVEEQNSDLDKPLSDWDAKVASGDLPAVIMNATIVETGQRLLLGTTRFSAVDDSRARVDGRTLHGNALDVAAVTAARLSASFAYVTPASRSDLPGPQVHVVDGGYYDNYGMSTLVEWLDEALDADAKSHPDQRSVESVLVIQIHGSPVTTSDAPAGDVRNRGWFFQILAPILTLNSVRGAGQIAHNDIELGQLQEKWFQRKIPIHSVTFEFPDDNAPLSWHLTQAQKERIIDRWVNTPAIGCHRKQVRQFLDGSDNIDCHCPTCNFNLGFAPVARAATP